MSSDSRGVVWARRAAERARVTRTKVTILAASLADMEASCDPGGNALNLARNKRRRKGQHRDPESAEERVLLRRLRVRDRRRLRAGRCGGLRLRLWRLVFVPG